MTAIEQLLVTLGFEKVGFNWDSILWAHRTAGIEINRDELLGFRTGSDVACFIASQTRAQVRSDFQTQARELFGVRQ